MNNDFVNNKSYFKNLIEKNQNYIDGQKKPPINKSNNPNESKDNTNNNNSNKDDTSIDNSNINVTAAKKFFEKDDKEQTIGTKHNNKPNNGTAPKNIIEKDDKKQTVETAPDQKQKSFPDEDESYNESQFSEFTKSSIEMFRKDVGKVNILVAGETGVGKSTLINSIFHKNMAITGVGKPITQDIEEFSEVGFPISIIDTKGLEIADYQKIINKLEEYIIKRQNEKDMNDQIHVGWVCIAEVGARFQLAASILIRLLLKYNIPVIIVLTKLDYLADNESKEKLKKAIMSEHPNLKDRIIRVQSIPRCIEINGKTINIPIENLDMLVDLTNNVIPEGLENVYKTNKNDSETTKIFSVSEITQAFENKKIAYNEGNKENSINRTEKVFSNNQNFYNEVFEIERKKLEMSIIIANKVNLKLKKEKAEEKIKEYQNMEIKNKKELSKYCVKLITDITGIFFLKLAENDINTIINAFFGNKDSFIKKIFIALFRCFKTNNVTKEKSAEVFKKLGNIYIDILMKNNDIINGKIPSIENIAIEIKVRVEIENNKK